MLLKLPLDLQKKVLSHLTVEDTVALRPVNRGYRDLATTCIDRPDASLRPPPGRDRKQLSVGHAPETAAQRCVADRTHEPGLPDRATRLATNICQVSKGTHRLEIDTGTSTFETLRCYEVSNAVKSCLALEEIHLSAYAIEMTADDDFLRKVVSLRTVQHGDPPYPPACFLASGLCLPNRLPRCTQLKELVTYTRSNEDTWYLTESLDRLPALETLELLVPCLDYLDMTIKATGAQFPKVQELVLIDKQKKNSTFPFDLKGVPSA